MYYLVFRPRRTKVNEDRFQYDYRNQPFVGFTQDLNDALKMAWENKDSNYQIYVSDNTNLNFRRGESVRYGFKYSYSVYVPYKRTPEGQETLIDNPFLSDEDNRKRMDEIKNKRLYGVRKRIKELSVVEESIQKASN